MPPAEAAADTTPARPLADSELTGLFAPLAGAGRIALAVSGGADSLALLDAVDRWRKGRGRPDVVVLTVDHRLQPGSGAVAESVTSVARSRGLRARTLVRDGPAPSAGVEAAAREARYRLLRDACREEGATHLVLAHHRDDVAETFLMRLARGSGIFGLAAMRPMIDAGGVIIVRPFLAVPRARLAAATAAAGLTPFDDPMNSDPRFARTAVRRFLAASGLDPAVLAGLAARFADLADRIDAEATAFIAGVVAADEFAVAWLDRAAFASLPPEVRGRVLVRVLMAIGAEDYPPRSPRLAGLMEAMLRADKGRFKRTLAGAVVERRGGRFAVYREAGRTPLPPVPVAPGETIVFDRRFAVAVDPGSVAEGLTVASLTIAEGVAVASRRASRGLPAGALAALPALRRKAEILAIPGLLDGPATFRSLLAERLSRPPLFPIAIPIATVRSPSVNPAAIAVFPS